MGNGRTRLRRIVIGAMTMLLVAGAGACLSFGDLTGGSPSSDAGADVALVDADVVTSIFDAGENADGAPVTFMSCAAAHAQLPSAPDALYLLTGVDGGPPFQAYCDMTNDNGGWMLVTEPMIKNEINTSVTAVHKADGRGGLIVQVYPNTNPCGTPDAGPVATETITFSVDRAWTQIRAQYGFQGLTSCWSVFGSPDLGATKNTLPFQLGIDTIYGQVEMGGTSSDGDATVDTFDGVVHRCDQANTNFWQTNVGMERGAFVILRRNLPGPAGLATQANCLKGAGPGTTGTTWWEYSNIYIR